MKCLQVTLVFQPIKTAKVAITKIQVLKNVALNNHTASQAISVLVGENFTKGKNTKTNVKSVKKLLWIFCSNDIWDNLRKSGSRKRFFCSFITKHSKNINTKQTPSQFMCPTSDFSTKAKPFAHVMQPSHWAIDELFFTSHQGQSYFSPFHKSASQIFSFPPM